MNDNLVLRVTLILLLFCVTELDTTPTLAQSDTEDPSASSQGSTISGEEESSQTQEQDADRSQDEENDTTDGESVASDLEISSKKSNQKGKFCSTCENLNTRLSGRLLSEVFLMRRPRARINGDGTYERQMLTVLPFYETLQLRGDELFHKGLSVHFQGWTGLDLADVYFDDRAYRLAADPTYLYIQFQDYIDQSQANVNIKAGRQMVFTGTARGLHLDGGYARLQAPFHLGMEVLGGLVVSPYAGPEWYREQPAVNFDAFGPGFSDWDREGEYAAGGRLFYQLTSLFSAGVSILHITEQEEVAEQLVGADLYSSPFDWLEATANASLDLPTTSIQQIDLILDFYPFSALSFSAQVSHVDPTMYLSHMSIFSVFSSEQYQSIGGTVRVKPLDWLKLHTGYHQRLYTNDVSSNTDYGYELDAGALVRYLSQREGIFLINYRRLEENEKGLHHIRAGVQIPFSIDGLKIASNVYLDIYDEKINQEELGFLADIGVFYGEDLFEGGGSVSAGSTPYDEEEIRAMAKLAYNFDFRFVERRQQ